MYILHNTVIFGHTSHVLFTYMHLVRCPLLGLDITVLDIMNLLDGPQKSIIVKFCYIFTRVGFLWSVDLYRLQVHGGTAASDIQRKVSEAVAHAQSNNIEFPDMQTVLFFDEANTTEDIGLIKEIMCDHTIGGEPLMETHGLKLIAACNSYRK